MRTTLPLVAAALVALAGLVVGSGGMAGAPDDPVERARPPSPGEAEAVAASRPTLQGAAPAHIARDAEPGAAQAAVEAPRPATERVRLEGIVRDAQGRPVAGARVRAPSGPVPGAEAVSDEQGRFALEVPAPGAYALLASAAGDRSLEATAFGDPALAVTLTAGPTLRGRVVDATARVGVVGLLVSARPITAAYGQALTETLTEAEGAFLLRVPREGAYALLVGEGVLVGASDLDGYATQRLERAETGPREWVIEVARGLSIEGRLLDDAGDPVRVPVWIDAVGFDEAGGADFTRRRRALQLEGLLRVPGLPPGLYDLHVTPSAQADAGQALPFAATDVRGVRAGTTGLTVRLGRGLMLRGALQRPDGTPVAGPGLVLAYPEGQLARVLPVPAQVPGDGTFLLGPLEQGLRYDLLATGFAGLQEQRAPGVDPRNGTVGLTLVPGGRISGRVVTAQGSPVADGVPVGLLAPGDPARAGARRFVTTTRDGAFLADGLALDAYDVEAGGGASGYVGVTAKGVATGAADVVLRVVEGVDLAGMLVDAAGAPVATTSLQGDDGAHRIAMRPYAQVGPDGRFRLRGLAPGKVRLTLRRDDAWLALGEAEAPGTDVRVVVPAR